MRMRAVAILSVVMVVVGCALCYPAPDQDQDYLEHLAGLAASKGHDLVADAPWKGRGMDAFDVLYGNERDYPAQYKQLAIQALEQQMMDKQRGGPGAVLSEEESTAFNGGLVEVADWDVSGARIGQVGGVAVCPAGFPHIFHRADRTWTARSFDENNVFTEKEPIHMKVVVTVHPENGSVAEEWGEDKFYLPHGLTIDGEGNLWLTDVALHQVFKYSPNKELLLTLGEALVPGADEAHFCKPTDVAVASNGEFFVADGYCNSRVVKFSADGKYLGEFGALDGLNVPHSIVLLEKYDTVCVADRENERIVCYGAGLRNGNDAGRKLRVYDDESMGRVYSIAYSPQDDLLYGIGMGDEMSEEGGTHGFTIDVSEDQGYYTDIVSEWAPPQGFMFPHAMAASPDGETVYVGELYTDKEHKAIWKFVKKEQPKEEGVNNVEKEEEEEEEDEEETQAEEPEEEEEAETEEN